MAIRKRRPGKLSKAIILLYYCARPHTANFTSLWQPLAGNSPGLSHSDSYVFGSMNISLLKVCKVNTFWRGGARPSILMFLLRNYWTDFRAPSCCREVFLRPSQKSLFFLLGDIDVWICGRKAKLNEACPLVQSDERTLTDRGVSPVVCVCHEKLCREDLRKYIFEAAIANNETADMGGMTGSSRSVLCVAWQISFGLLSVQKLCSSYRILSAFSETVRCRQSWYIK
jgi:hypothetical protein